MAVFEQKGGTSGGSYASYFTGRLTVTETGTKDITNNKSYVYYKLELVSGSSGRFSSYSASYSVTLDGVVRNSGSGSYSSQSYNTAQTICDGYAWIDHEPDGRKTLSCSAVLDFASGTYSPGDFTPSGTMALTTIPRASSITATDANIGSASTIIINRASSSFTHTITYSFKNTSGTIATKTTETTISWTVPTGFFQQIPNDSSGIVTLTCQTFSGNTQIGDAKTTTMTATVPYSGTYNSTPVITSATAIDTNTTTKNLTGNNKRLVLYKSTVQLSATGQCKNYAGFKSFKENNIYDLTSSTSVSGGTTTVTGSKTYSASTTPIFNQTQFKLYLIDTRNTPSAAKILNQANGDFTIIPYIPLTLSPTVTRASATSSTVYLNFSGKFYNGYYDANNANFNTLTLKWRYKEDTSGSSWSSYTNLTLNTHFKYGSGNTYYSGSGNSQANITLGSSFDYQKPYIIEIYYADRLSSYTIQKPVSKGIPIHDEGVDSNGNNYFNVNGELYKNNEKALQRHIMTITKTTNQNVTPGQSEVIIQMNSTKGSVGSKLTFSNYSVKIGTGVNYVLASGLCWAEQSNGYKWITIKKKSGSSYTTVASAITPRNSNEDWDSVSLPPTLIGVSQNDEISMWVATTGSATGRVSGQTYPNSTYLTVEVVG